MSVVSCACSQHRHQKHGTLLNHKLFPARLGDLQERIARHVLYARVLLLHELKELVDDGSQKLYSWHGRHRVTTSRFFWAWQSLSLSLSLSRSRHTTYLPVGFQEARILAHDIHNVGGNHGLVVLALRRAAHAQQVLNHGDQELLFGLLMLRATDGSDGPAQAVEVVPPFVLVSTAFDQYALLRADRCNVLVKERT